MRKFLKFVRDDNVYCKYYEAFYILFHTGMRISELCGLTIKDVDLENNIVTIDHRLLRTSKMEYIIQSTKTNGGTRKLPITEEDIYRIQMPNITPHVCRHTYCSNMEKAGMNPKTLQYFMGHSDIGVTMNTCTHLGLEGAKDEMIRMEELNTAKKELEKVKGLTKN